MTSTLSAYINDFELEEGKKLYFASDLHLGIPDKKRSLEREKCFISWLEYIRKDAQAIFLLGDIFDFWFEYKHAVPLGYVRLLGKIAEITDSGIPIYYFTGNHDMWIFNYLPEETGVQLCREPIQFSVNSRKFYIGHGDGLGPSDKGYKFIKKVFSARFSQWLFARFHPNFGIGLANYFSRKSRLANGDNDEVFMGDDKEFLIQFCKEKVKEEELDYFIFGHRHLTLDIKIGEKARYINTGEWVKQRSFGVFDGKEFSLKNWQAD